MNFDQQYARLKVDLESLEIEETNETLTYESGEMDKTEIKKHDFNSWSSRNQRDWVLSQIYVIEHIFVMGD